MDAQGQEGAAGRRSGGRVVRTRRTRFCVPTPLPTTTHMGHPTITRHKPPDRACPASPAILAWLLEPTTTAFLPLALRRPLPTRCCALLPTPRISRDQTQELAVVGGALGGSDEKQRLHEAVLTLPAGAYSFKFIVDGGWTVGVVPKHGCCPGV